MNDEATRQHEGTRAFGDLEVTWRGRPAGAGWDVDCGLRLGSASAGLRLDADNPRQPFALRDGSLAAWGHMDLSPAPEERVLVLRIDCHTAPASEETTCLCAWRACDPCEPRPPSEGRKTLGEGGWIEAAWTIGGAESACLEARVAIGVAGEASVDTAVLTPLSPVWRKSLRRSGGHAELALVLSVAEDGRARIDAVLNTASDPGERADLDRFPIHGRPPIPEPDQVPGSGVVFGRPREFASFTFPRGIEPPTPGQWLRRFIEIDAETDFQNTLRDLAAKKDRDGMIAEGQDFVATTSKKYPGQYVRRIADLSGPMGRLEGPRVHILLAMHPDSQEALREAVETLLGTTIETFLASADYAPQLARLQDSLIALLVTGSFLGSHERALIEALRVCHVSELLDRAPERLHTPETLREPLEASTLLPAAILPLPAPADAVQNGYAKPLGFADLQVIHQRLLRYRLGEIAHVENVMRGETKERSEERRRRLENDEREHDQRRDEDIREQTYQGDSGDDRESRTNPLNVLKREFDNLKQEYGSDGLSVTVTGSWTDTPTGPATLDRNAEAYARRLLDHASARVARRVAGERSRRTVEEFAEQNRRRFDNAEGDGHLTGIYRWIDEIHLAHLEARGSRLVLEIVLADPARDYVRRNNVLNGIDFTPPIPPWTGGDGIPPLHSAADVTRDNYAALAARYNASDVPPPPPANLALGAALANDPPKTQATLDIPPGYAATGGTVSYAWSTSATATTQTLDVLVNETALKIDPTQDANPGTKAVPALQAGTASVRVAAVGAGLDFAANVTLNCTCSDGADVFRCWQIAAYNAIVAAYGVRRDEYLAAMTRLAARPEVSPGMRGRDTERVELEQAAIECLIAPFLSQPVPGPALPAWRRDAAAFTLIPFFRDTLDWSEMTYAFYGRYFAPNDPERPAWLPLRQTADSAPGFDEFLQAGAARILVPVKPPQVLPLLFYLASSGQFWSAAAESAPVHEADWWLANELKTLRHAPQPRITGESWEVETATAMLMLQPDASLPELGDTQGETP